MILAGIAIFWFVAFVVLTIAMVFLAAKRSTAKKEARALLDIRPWTGPEKERAQAIIKKLDLWVPDKEAKGLITRMNRRAAE